eukprot:386457_1
MNILVFTTSILSITNSGILEDYSRADDTIKSGLIQTAIDNDNVAFCLYVSDLGWAGCDLLFSFIQRTASPQLGPGLAFGQFERRSQWTSNDITEVMQLEELTLGRNIGFDKDHGGIKFQYKGIYKVSVEFITSHSTEGNRWSRVQFRGLVNTDVVGRSVLGFTGRHGDTVHGLSTFSFLIDIQDINDIYLLELLRNNGDSATFILYTFGTFESNDKEVNANCVVVVENIGQ